MNTTRIVGCKTEPFSVVYHDSSFKQNSFFFYEHFRVREADDDGGPCKKMMECLMK